MADTWNESAEDAVDAIFQNVRSNPTVYLTHLRKEVDKFIDDLYRTEGGTTIAQTRWANIGATAIELAAKRDIQFTPTKVVNTLVRKQADYGPENIRRFGRQGLLVRLHDKIARLENLEETGRNPANETIADNYLDVVGYSAIGIMWESRTFLLPLQYP